MTVYVVLGKEPYYGAKVTVLGVYRSKQMAAEVSEDYSWWRGYKDVEVIEEWME